MSVTNKALWVIERNLRSNLSLDDLAGACGVSRFHLAHAFGQTLGQSVMDFVRGRRLSDAARRLAAGAPDILDLALESGYDSHEAFSRAFKKRFGVTPDSVRRRATVDGLPLVDPQSRSDRAGVEVGPPKVEDRQGLLAVGLSSTYAFGAADGIAGQWQRFMATAAADIPHRVAGIPIGIATTVDADGGFAYVTAVEVSALADPVAGLQSLRIAPRRWAIFEHTAHVSTLSQTYAAIWDRWLDAHDLTLADAPSIERHKPAFDPRTGNGGVDIWIPVHP